MRTGVAVRNFAAAVAPRGLWDNKKVRFPLILSNTFGSVSTSAGGLPHCTPSHRR